MEFKYNNKTAVLLIRFARALKIEDKPGWKGVLAEKFGVSSNALSNWIERDDPNYKRLTDTIEKYKLPKNILIEENDASRIITKETIDKWPFMLKGIELINSAAHTDDIHLLKNTLQYLIDSLENVIPSELKRAGNSNN